jgi:uncharacterized protein YkwD
MIRCLLAFVLLIAEPDFVGIDNTMVMSCNSIRGRHHRSVLFHDQRLTNAAQDHANFIARYPCRLIGDTYCNAAFRHDNNGGSEYRRQKYGWNHGGFEVIAMQPKGWQANCWTSWMHSGPHLSTLLGNHTHCGFASAVGADGCVYTVGVFGSK